MEKEYGGLLDTRLVFSTFKEYKLRRLIILKLFIKMNTSKKATSFEYIIIVLIKIISK